MQVLCQFNKNHIMRSELIDVAMKLIGLEEEKASGLIDRGIHQLKSQNLVHAKGCKPTRYYLFNETVMQQVILMQDRCQHYDLTSEQRSLQKELAIAEYELETYEELLQKVPLRKQHILQLHEKTQTNLLKLNGKIRALSQLLVY